jgi:hypothetical protein
MKKTWVFLVFLAVLSFSTVVWAEDPLATPVVPDPQITKVEGDANQAVSWTHGDDNAGGFSGTVSSGKYKAEDFCETSGSSTADGIAKGSDNLGTNPGFSTSEGKTSSGAAGNGSKNSIDISGFTEEYNHVSIADATNGSYADGFNYTNDQYKGSLSSDKPISGSGLGDSIGETSAFTAETPTSRSAAATTNGGSTASLTIPGTTSVYGIEGTDAFSKIEGTGYYTGAAGSNNATYNGYGGQDITGVVNGSVVTHVEISPDSIRASSASSSGAKLTPCGNGPCAQ